MSSSNVENSVMIKLKVIYVDGQLQSIVYELPGALEQTNAGAGEPIQPALTNGNVLVYSFEWPDTAFILPERANCIQFIQLQVKINLAGGAAMQPAGIDTSDNSQIVALGPAIEPEHADHTYYMQQVLNDASVPVNMHASEQGNPAAMQPTLINDSGPLNRHAIGQIQAIELEHADHTNAMQPVLNDASVPVNMHASEPGNPEAMQPTLINDNGPLNRHAIGLIQAIELEHADHTNAMQPVLNDASLPVNMHASEQGNLEAMQPTLINDNEPLNMHAIGQIQAFEPTQCVEHTKINVLPPLISGGVPVVMCGYMVWHRNEANLEHCDEESIMGHFGWAQFGDVPIPYIYRHSEKYCSVHMIQLKLLMQYLNCLHPDTYAFIPRVSSYSMTASEKRLFIEINKKHDNAQWGSHTFTQSDWLVRLNDAFQFYQYLDVCYRKLVHVNKAPTEKCGFMRINNRSLVPFTICNYQKMLPLFYFRHDTKLLKAQLLTGWDLAYLKFCFKVQGSVGNDLLRAENVAVVSLYDIMSIFPSSTVFEEYWPKMIISKMLMANLTHPYKMQKLNVNNKLVWCINMLAFINTPQLMTLTEFQRNFFPIMPLIDCKRHIEALGMLMYKPNQHQAELLKDYDSAYTEYTPLIRVKDIVMHMAQLNFLLFRPDPTPEMRMG